MGRAVRNKSHQFLPEAQRYVDIHILVNAMPGVANIPNPQAEHLTREHQDYIEKVRDHRLVLQIEKIIHSVAIDVTIYGHNYFTRTVEGSYTIEEHLRLLPF